VVEPLWFQVEDVENPHSGPTTASTTNSTFNYGRDIAELQPIVLQQTSDTHDGLVRQWKRPDQGVNTHRAYALQWYAMGVLVVILYFALNLRRGAGGNGAG